MSVHCILCNLKRSSDTCYHWVVTERNSRIFPTSTVAPKFIRFESSSLQRAGTIAREGVRNMHHWSARTETATENRLRQRLCHHCDSDSSVASLISPLSRSVMRVFVHLLWQYFPHAVVNWIQIWRIWRRSWAGINSGVSFCDNSMVARA